MCAIIECEFPEHPEKNLRLFPAELLIGKKAMHGTCEIYCGDIETNGFQQGWSPFEPDQGAFFVQMLRDHGMPDQIEGHDTPKITIDRYLQNRGRASLSFAFSGYEALYYATELRRGGQIYVGIREALNWIEDNECQLSEVQQELFNDLTDKINELNNSRGCIYLIDFSDDDLEPNIRYNLAINHAVDSFHALFYNEGAIPSHRIVAKMYVPLNYVLSLDLLRRAKRGTDRLALVRDTYLFNLIRDNIQAE